MDVLEYMGAWGHEQILMCSDPAVGLKAVIAIHDTTLGPALGGVRIWPYGSEEEGLMDVLRLSKAMTYKSAAADLPFGGGPGMVIRPDVVSEAIDAAAGADPSLALIYLTPRGCPLTQARVGELARGPGIVLLCGRYEGLDERVLDAHGLAEISLGDFVLSGGEAAAITLIEHVKDSSDLRRARLLAEAGGDRSVALVKQDGPGALRIADTGIKWTQQLMLQVMGLTASGLALLYVMIATFRRNVRLPKKSVEPSGI